MQQARSEDEPIKDELRQVTEAARGSEKEEARRPPAAYDARLGEWHLDRAPSCRTRRPAAAEDVVMSGPH